MAHIPRWQVLLTLLVCLLGAAFAAPNLLGRQTAEGLPSWLPHKQINLGLDLRGGSHLLLEVDAGAVLRERLDGVVDSVREELRRARLRYDELGISGEVIGVVIPDPAQRAEARNLLVRLDPDLTVEDVGEGRFRLSFSEQAVSERVSSAVEQSLEIVRRRIDETGVREPSIQRQGSDRILVQLPGVDDPQRIKALIGKTAKMTFHLVDDSPEGMEGLATGRVPPGSVVLPLVERKGAAPQRIVIRKRIMVSGENLVDARPEVHTEPVVAFRFDGLGARKFGEVSSQNVGKRLAIVLDNQVISAPQIREPILGGSGQISGSFTVQEAQDLALLLRAGALPAPLTVLEERTVGPGLGADSIAAGETAAVVGIIAVALFMILAYGLFGLFADLALIINMILLLGAMSALQATLTLPGIAGIVLTVGMAVDANVLIYEHIREEIRNGRSPIAALDAGFKRAMSAILDSNITTLISGFFLYVFGSGPVRGFAVTLSIGIITTIFTAVTVTRLIVFTWQRHARPRALPI